MSGHLKTTILNSIIFGILTVLWDVLIDNTMNEALLKALVLTSLFGITIYFMNRKKEAG